MTKPLPILLPDRQGDGGRGNPLKMPLIPAQELINKLCEFGMPRRQAEMLRTSFQLRCFATLFYFDVIEMENGDAQAKERIDYQRTHWIRMRYIERALGNDPDEPAKPGALKADLMQKIQPREDQ